MIATYLADDHQQTYVRNGRNMTGDTFLRTLDGYFVYQARSDDMIVSSGYNIAGPEVEEVLLTHPDVVECAVVGTPDDERGTVVTAFVVLREGITASADKARELQDFAKNAAAPYKYPRRVELVTGLPRNPSGKLQRYLLRSPDDHPLRRS